MSVNDEQLSTAAAAPIVKPRHRWATCTDCGHHFALIPGDQAAVNAQLRRAQLDASRIEFLARYNELSEREREVMIRIARGEMPLQMAQELGIHVKTVSTYRARLMEKLNLGSNVAIAVAAYKAGLMQ